MRKICGEIHMEPHDELEYEEVEHTCQLPPKHKGKHCCVSYADGMEPVYRVECGVEWDA